jgi:lipid-binding SYLF domain-containing protein
MSDNQSSQVQSEKIVTETHAEPASITVNDPSFNVRFQPHTVPSQVESFKANIKEKFDQASAAFSDSVDFSMEALLKQALLSFQNFTDPSLPVEQRIPFHLLEDAKGIMFLSVWKGGIGLGGIMGSGIIMARNPNWRQEWTAPCAVALGGVQIGLNIGIEKTDHIIVIRDEDVITKFRSGVRLGGDISLSVGPLGRDTNVGLTLNQKGALTNVSYSMSKGMYLGFALEGCIITIRNDCNERFFGQKFDVSEILNELQKAYIMKITIYYAKV